LDLLTADDEFAQIIQGDVYDWAVAS